MPTTTASSCRAPVYDDSGAGRLVEPGRTRCRVDRLKGAVHVDLGAQVERGSLVARALEPEPGVRVVEPENALAPGRGCGVPRSDVSPGVPPAKLTALESLDLSVDPVGDTSSRLRVGGFAVAPAPCR